MRRSSPPTTRFAARLLRAIPLAIALAALASASAAATTLLAYDDERLVDESTIVVTGTCEAVHTEWRDGLLVRLASIRVEQVLKGEPGREVTVVIPGGIDLDREVPVAVTVPGAPAILPHERVLLFLEPAAAGASLDPRATAPGTPLELEITGFSQGKFSILEGAGGEPVVLRDLRGAALARGHHLTTGGARSVPLAQFEEQIRRRVLLGRADGALEPRNRQEPKP